MDSSDKMSYNAGQAQEKTESVVEKASNAAQSAEESIQEAGQQMMAKAHDAADAIKDATGMNKSD